MLHVLVGTMYIPRLSPWIREIVHLIYANNPYMWRIREIYFLPFSVGLSKVDILNLAALSCCQVGSFWVFWNHFFEGVSGIWIQWNELVEGWCLETLPHIGGMNSSKDCKCTVIFSPTLMVQSLKPDNKTTRLYSCFLLGGFKDIFTSTSLSDRSW